MAEPHCLYLPLFLFCSSVDEHPGWFYHLAAVNFATARVGKQAPVLYVDFSCLGVYQGAVQLSVVELCQG